jgi:hypothetical protein
MLALGFWATIRVLDPGDSQHGVAGRPREANEARGPISELKRAGTGCAPPPYNANPPNLGAADLQPMPQPGDESGQSPAPQGSTGHRDGLEVEPLIMPRIFLAPTRMLGAASRYFRLTCCDMARTAVAGSDWASPAVVRGERGDSARGQWAPGEQRREAALSGSADRYKAATTNPATGTHYGAYPPPPAATRRSSSLPGEDSAIRRPGQITASPSCPEIANGGYSECERRFSYSSGCP